MAQGRRPIFVSQLAEDSARQVTYAKALGGADWHQQWSHRIVFKGEKETSTRARSMAFYGLAVLATSMLPTKKSEILVAENGFISLNPPLLQGRMASLSTNYTSVTHALATRTARRHRYRSRFSCPTGSRLKRKCCGNVRIKRSSKRMPVTLQAVDVFVLTTGLTAGVAYHVWSAKLPLHHWGHADTTNYKFSSLPQQAKRVRMIPWR